MARYEGKQALITGGISGIGLATARLLISEGVRVLLTGRTQKTLDAAREEFGESAIVVESDAASLSDIENLAGRVRTDFQPFDALFVNAGQTRFARLKRRQRATMTNSSLSTLRGLTSRYKNSLHGCGREAAWCSQPLL